MPAPRRRAGAIAKAAASGDRLALLVAMRDRVAGDLDSGVAARDLASLTRRLLEITKEIEAIHAAARGDAVGAAASTEDEAWAG
jgi:hypothetical protein